MANTRNTNTLEEASSPEAILELSQLAREGKVLGIGMCHLNPSGCYDIAKGISLQLQNAPFVKVQYKDDPRTEPGSALAMRFLGISPKKVYQPLNAPPQLNVTSYDTVFFTGCVKRSSGMLAILNLLSQHYQFTNIRHVYQIAPPHHPKGRPGDESDMAKTLQFFKNTPYQYRFIYSGIDNRSPSNIGMPRFESKPSEFKVPLECYGVIRHRNVEDFLPLQNGKCSPGVEKHLNEYFRQVADAGKDSLNKPIMVIAIGIESKYRTRMVEIAKQHSVVIDFCDQYSGNRLPQQDDFFKVLTTIKDRKGIVSFDETSTQCLLQAVSFGAPCMIYSHGGLWPHFYAQLVKIVPPEYQPTAQTILGLNDNFELLKDRAKCEKVYELLHSEVNKSHQKFDNFKNYNFALMTAAANGDVTAVKELAEKKVNVNQSHLNGWTPLMLAAKKGHLGVVEILLQNGADATQALPDGMTAFMIAVAKGHVDIVNKLLTPQNVNQACADGWTPLMFAAEKGYIKIFKILLQNGADATKTLPNGMTLSRLAEINRHVNIIKLLLKTNIKQTQSNVKREDCVQMNPTTTDSSEAKPSLARASSKCGFFIPVIHGSSQGSTLRPSASASTTTQTIGTLSSLQTCKNGF